MNNLNPLKAQPYSMKILFVIASDRFLDMGYTVPKKLLEEHGIECVTASTVRGNCYGMQGEIAQADLTINDVDPAEYDGIIIDGGIGCQDELWRNEKLIDITNKIGTSGKVAAAICLAPVILGEAGLLAGKKTACFETPATVRVLTLDKAEVSHDNVVTDGRIVTAKTPFDAEEFARAILSVLL
ncbi:DJ-1/PfpI family protein [Methanocorpusculum bavaricum]|jgi:protease I|nr:DJ-1/PfpI family protein [Methanocorpusculum bavaricum]MDD4423755.1 DJ-1/PfpI family protein [Methanocorpusculum parvum]MEA5086981.1 DJ-1/PfpI family protein [Methanocorpusculum sp.]